MKVTKAFHKTWKHGYYLTSKLDIPAGLKVKELKDGLGQSHFILDEFPVNLFPYGSFERHDAIHYGLTLNINEMEDK